MTALARDTFSSLPRTLDTVRKDHFVQHMLCRDMEAIADGLPALPALPEVQALCDRIAHVTRSHFDRAEAAFAALPARQCPESAALAMLHQMHQLDEIHSQDMVAALIAQASCPDPARVGQLAAADRAQGKLDRARRADGPGQTGLTMSSSRAGLRMRQSRLPSAKAMIEAARSRVIWRLTVSMVSPR